MHTLKIDFQFSPEQGKYGLWLRRVDHFERKTEILTDTGCAESRAGEYSSATAYLEKIELEDLMAKLWANGIRPSEWGHEGEVAALRDHLADERGMREQLLASVLRAATPGDTK